jgi:hypothetical protein
MSERQALPAARGQITLATNWPVDVASGYKISYGLFSDGRPAELFIATNKASSDAESIARDAAIMISIALQYGARFDDLRVAVTRDAGGRPASIIGHALDLVAADMGGGQS